MTPSLITRLKEATGGDREIDADTRLGMLGDCPYGVLTGNRHQVIGTSPLSAYVEAYRDTLNADDALDDEVVPRYTACTDAAFALVAAKLPGWQWSLTQVGEKVFACLGRPGKPPVWTEAPTAPLALLIALCTAMEGNPPTTKPVNPEER